MHKEPCEVPLHPLWCCWAGKARFLLLWLLQWIWFSWSLVGFSSKLMGLPCLMMQEIFLNGCYSSLSAFSEVVCQLWLSCTLGSNNTKANHHFVGILAKPIEQVISLIVIKCEQAITAIYVISFPFTQANAIGQNDGWTTDLTQKKTKKTPPF